MSPPVKDARETVGATISCGKMAADPTSSCLPIGASPGDQAVALMITEAFHPDCHPGFGWANRSMATAQVASGTTFSRLWLGCARSRSQVSDVTSAVLHLANGHRPAGPGWVSTPRTGVIVGTSRSRRRSSAARPSMVPEAFSGILGRSGVRWHSHSEQLEDGRWRNLRMEPSAILTREATRIPLGIR